MAARKFKKNECRAGYGIIKQVLKDKDGRTVHVTDNALKHASKNHWDEVKYFSEIENILLNYDERREDNFKSGMSYIKVFDVDGISVKIKVATHGCVATPKAGADRRVNHVSSVYRIVEVKKK